MNIEEEIASWELTVKELKQTIQKGDTSSEMLYQLNEAEENLKHFQNLKKSIRD